MGSLKLSAQSSALFLAKFSPDRPRRLPQLQARITQNAFTLVELLVVIGIISTLAAMLLPTLEKSIVEARRISCLNNLRSIYQKASMYTNDFDGALPKGSISTHAYDRENSLKDGFGSPPEGGAAKPAWLAFVNSGYIGRYEEKNSITKNYGAMNKPGSYTCCPDNGHLYGSWLHYGYRYNFINSSYLFGSTSWNHDTLGAHPSKALFSESFTRRNFVNGVAIPQYGGTDDGFVGPYKWAHLVGGNVVRHDGAGRFILNRPSLFWPNFSYGTYFTNLDNLF